ncbi:response regulator [Cohnella ginsengisoli]|uniref:Response regulator n=1 Tax=Cohnella ginsengisoli TaxID=425004 RepID=A0A9X4KGI3_9BACL|nr:response regulator [Cohnella ginsengisoli]MDG0791531.1 response regulator [Cohnella ginsengisoli]
MLRLLIVDDEPIILSGIRDMVEQANTAFTKIVTAGDGVEALEKMDYFMPDLIITDIQMPEMHGLDFISLARERGVNRFIVLSGYDMFEYARRAIQLQVVEYMLKPVDEKELIELLKRIAIEVLERQEKIQREKARPPGARSAIEEAPYSEHVQMLQKYIASNYRRDISLTDAAAYLGLHPVYIGKLYKKRDRNVLRNSHQSAAHRKSEGAALRRAEAFPGQNRGYDRF